MPQRVTARGRAFSEERLMAAAEARDSTEIAPFLGVRPQDRRLALAVVLASILAFALAAPFARTPLPRIEPFIPIYQTALIIGDLVTAVLLLGQSSSLRSDALVVLAGAYLFSAFMAVAHALSFPGLFAPSGLFGSGPQTTAWLYFLWHGGFPLAVIAYARLKDREMLSPDARAPASRPGTWRAAALAVLAAGAAAVGLMALTTAGHDAMPVIMEGNQDASRKILVAAGTWALSLGALYTLWRQRSHTIIDLWLMVVMCAWLFDVALSAVLNAGRFDLGFYAGRVYGLLAGSFVLAVLLLEINRLYGEVARSSAIVRAAKAQVDDYARRLEDKVQISEEKYRLFMEHAQDGILVLDPDGRIVEANREAEVLLGRPRASFVGRMLGEFAPADDAPHMHAGLGLMLAKDAFRIDNLRLRRESGEPPYVDAVSSRIRVGAESLVLVIARDVSDRAKLEHQLRQTQKMEAIGNLTGGLAHDFNNLLLVILGSLDQLAMKLKNDADAMELANAAIDAGERGAELNRRLLAFARRQPLQPRSIDANALVQGMTALLRRTLGGAIKIELQLDPEAWRIRVDAAQLEAAILNLAINARDAMPKGGVLTIGTINRVLDEDFARLQPDVVPGDYLAIEVADTGTGMPREVAQHIFEPFFTTKGPGKGTGLGLAMVFGFVKQSGGHISPYSEVGYGTTMRIYLPRQAAEEATAGAGAATAALAAAAGETVMVVEDDPKVRRIVVRNLVDLGYRVIEASSATEALAQLRNGVEADLLFTDVVMPGGMTGIELARAAMVDRPGLKILLTSGFAEAALKEGGLMSGDLQLLSKPYRRDELARRLRAALGASAKRSNAGAR
jgi:PAS domain S-box-containing protein